MIKEEYHQQDTLDYIVKKEEEGGYLKIEENTSTSNTMSPLHSSNQNMTVPWLSTIIPGTVWPSYTSNIDLMNEFAHFRRKPSKPFRIIKEPYMCKSLSVSKEQVEAKVEEELPEEMAINIKVKKKRTQVSACKNYIALLCLGISRTILTAKNGSQIMSYVTNLFIQRKKKFDSLENQNNDFLVESLKKHIYKTMCGKKLKKSRRKKDFKIRNTEELDNLLTVRPKDTEIVSLIKQVLKETVDYFFNSNYYDHWLSTCMMSESNRNFFVHNKSEIEKKFVNPASYKPHFSHHVLEEL